MTTTFGFVHLLLLKVYSDLAMAVLAFVVVALLFGIYLLVRNKDF